MARKTLTRNERHVFYYLVKYPNVSDRIVAEKSKSKLSTVTAIKNRLKSQGYFKKIRIPCVYNLGFELFNATIWNINPDANKDAIFSDIRNYLRESQGFAGISGNILYLINFGLNYTETNTLITKLERTYWKHGLIDDLSAKIIKLMPFKDSMIFSYFDYAPILGRILGMKDRAMPGTIIVRPRANIKLTRIERMVYHGLISEPEWPDTMIANKYRVTRQVVAKLKKRWEYENILKTVREVNLEKLGMEIMEITSIKVKRTDSELKDSEQISSVLAEATPIFAILSGYDLFFITAHKNFTEYQATKTNLISKLKERGYYLGQPETTLLSLKDIKKIRPEFANEGLNRVLNIDLLEFGTNINPGNKMFR